MANLFIFLLEAHVSELAAQLWAIRDNFKENIELGTDSISNWIIWKERVKSQQLIPLWWAATLDLNVGYTLFILVVKPKINSENWLEYLLVSFSNQSLNFLSKPPNGICTSSTVIGILLSPCVLTCCFLVLSAVMGMATYPFLFLVSKRKRKQN